MRLAFILKTGRPTRALDSKVEIGLCRLLFFHSAPSPCRLIPKTRYTLIFFVLKFLYKSSKFPKVHRKALQGGMFNVLITSFTTQSYLYFNT